ncbi:lysoplasmalogenase family protein [Rhodococcus artemisiae]|uniref:Lysoplasmalogenase family protein n=1 Tax=Rhodococcus artemisiae TaxID=714159 RepID=A0ABU7LHK0_9NOCA|nr:lysoplasmalogenase family protein [Rhodococcus artemisiae]MEE2061038.1 lysoplasmalogenase family protein [Rhodococcus artemisiae]
MGWFTRNKWGVEHAVFVAASAATVVGGVLGNESVQKIAKPLIAPSLAVRVLRRSRDLDRADTALLLAGLTAATVGDMFMIDPDDDSRILRGAGAFAVMQTSYSTLLARHGARPTRTAVLQRVPAVLGAAGLLGWRSRSVAAPLTAYGTLLATTATLAADPSLAPGAKTSGGLVLPNADRRSWPGADRRSWPGADRRSWPGADRRSWLCLGGLVFTLSDGTIVERRTLLKNKSARAAAEGFVLATYAAAQLLLVEGMLALGRRT